MSERAVRRILWVAMALLLPLPLLGLQAGWVPAARMLLLGGLCAAFMLVETTRGVAPVLTGIFLGQAIVWLVVLWLSASAAALVLRGTGSRTRGVVTLALVLGAMLATVSFSLYRTPFAPRSAEATLLDVYR